MEKMGKSNFSLKIISLLLITYSISSNVLPRLSFDNKPLPTHKINMDLPVKERYKELLIENKYKVQAYAKVTSLQIPLPWIISKIGKLLFNKTSQEPEWTEYIEAVSEFCEISLSEAIMLSVTYDLACTSVVIQDEDDQILIGRNLDFNTYFVIAHLVFHADYYRNNELIYSGVELLGFRGIINAMKPGKFSVSLNLRYSSSKLENLYRIFKGFPTPNYFLMKVIEQANSYQVAKKLLSVFPLSSPVHFIISGVSNNQGSIISRTNQGLHSLTDLNVI